MKSILFTFISFISTFCYSQNYQTFTSNQTHYFKENVTGNILASEITDSEIFEADSIFYPFISIRRLDGVLKDSPSWMGEKIIIRSDGMNIFFNSQDDSIYIKTAAPIGDVYTMYTFPSGNIIEAFVDTILFESFYGISDSVKIISIYSVEPGFESRQFRLGKYLGLIDVYPFYSFPEKYVPIGGLAEEGISKYNLCGQLYPKMGITKPTKNEINNINIGDVISYHEFWGALSNWTFSKTVIDKVIISETVTYTFELFEKHEYHGTAEDDPAYTIYSTSIVTESYNISDEFNIHYLIPEKNYDSGFSDFFYGIKHDDACGYIERIFSNHSSYIGGGSYYDPTYYHDEQVYYSGGLNQGYHYFYFNDGHNEETHGRFYQGAKNDDLICGNPEFLSIPKVQLESLLIVYPNPASDLIHIDCLDGVLFTIWDSQGKMIRSGSVLKNKTTINLSEIESGLYILEVELASGEKLKTKFFKL